jgi:hypothetical protein
MKLCVLLVEFYYILQQVPICQVLEFKIRLKHVEYRLGFQSIENLQKCQPFDFSHSLVLVS